MKFYTKFMLTDFIEFSSSYPLEVTVEQLLSCSLFFCNPEERRIYS
ncbi:hypothetical protein SAMN05421821_118108 [Mucilaginibacter lappiensis]|uniref:Uncharacterized protein n=1 Tax=Mucilaginibacter lappiensis TaxID=354630 RepID=A0A1N7FM56_9SPHI|nr:hypothetical protein [Mucilaginibacter lappiensis]MBB6127119.1 hypothetical protein [Mucilaginibacter lappiensis]SIS01380.1 hypothetical protein SAMN05421821_118108 [Mucilaginibacter lappiensis]